METKENMQQTAMTFIELTNVSRHHLRKSEAAILDVIYASGTSGIIATEIGRELKHMPYGTVTSKFQELLRLGQIETIGKRKGPSGRMQKIYRHVDFSTEATKNYG